MYLMAHYYGGEIYTYVCVHVPASCVCDHQTAERSFLDSLVSYIIEVSLFGPEIKMMEDANEKSLGFLILIHQPGGGIIGNRVRY